VRNFWSGVEVRC